MEEFVALSMNWRSVLSGGVALTIALIGLALAIRKPNVRANRWLALFLFAAAINAIPFTVGFAGAYDIWPELTFLPVDMAPFFGPLLLLHTRAIIRAQPAGPWKWLLTPGIAYFLYQLWAFFLLGDYRAKWDFNAAMHDPYVMPLVLAVSVLLTVYSLWQIALLTREYRNWLSDNRSDDESFQPIWLIHFIVLLGAMVTAWLIDRTVMPVLGLDYFARYWPSLAALLIVLIMAIEAWYRFEQPYPSITTLSGPDIGRRETRDWAKEGRRVREVVVSQEWYLEPRFALVDLAHRMALNENYTSRAINQGLGESFSDFINHLRVERAKDLLRDPSASVLATALDAGFNSKASFNRAFKRFCGITPSEFRKTQTSQITKIQRNG
ncbi:helix-turn-helix domain-containing protein [Maricaulis sp. MIT060901]|uniref:helix-turn-helix domain-containing protein n=1 Tax=Maricaulis sp. MIT060901 TaxID=3096993 RepID=UPI00399B6F4D